MTTITTDRYSIIEIPNLARSLRDSGYKSPASAGAELCDNSFQAGANTFLVLIENIANGAAGKGQRNSQAKGIERVIFSDDGNGMDPMLLRNSMRFGYTTRFDDRGGMGRFGMGLPNASISQAKTFSVYSKVANGDWHYVRLNIDDIATGRVKEVPVPVIQEPNPNYITGEGTSGTIVIWEDLDRLNLRYQSADKLQMHLITEFSRIFRYFLVAGRAILVSTTKTTKDIKPFDPLYIMNEAQYSGAAQHGDVITIDVEKNDGLVDQVKVRFSLTPKEWQVSPDWVAIRAGSSENKVRRLHKNRGISFVRAGREIDFTPANGLKGSHPMNMWWSAEVSFPPTLDEQFGIEFTKQRVVLTEAMQEKLADKAFNPNVATLLNLIEARRPKAVPQVSSAQAEEIAARVKDRLRPVIGNPEKAKTLSERVKVKELMEEAAKKRRRVDETPEETIKRVLQTLPFVIQPEPRPGTPFYCIETYGSTTCIILNTHHSFYEKVYAPLAKIEGNALTGVQLLLFALAQGEAQAGLKVKDWYEDEILQWSGILTMFLRELPELRTSQSSSDETSEDE